MDPLWKESVWQQFGAAIDMLDNAIRACPDALWQDHSWDLHAERPEFSEFWYIAFHALFWLDLYLSGTREGFAPPAPFTLSELDPAGRLPERLYSKDDLLNYLAHGRRRCQATIESLTDERARERFRWRSGREMRFAELLIYNLRHVQEHASQLSLILGRTTGSAPDWVSQAKRNDSGT